ncbi:putative P-loop ATPase/GTPase [Caldisphaera lagunensis DSM 15908]|uniref:Putative P-loop ATPase/GTPase n=1 Tax=Caldisphaera lagunensis (strain DSM 15908 / JCM 11604 / ANMR 0165 / IC-154) TaxID=1056495 RepID=L0ABU9_CALLD|nr:P-loop ATPase/GTPase [Caldisphaera lagunensis]AFZ70525.1 putative P-loop ATPase/GTPase [Caldisphaera lagunensis DSM 15908]
MKVLVIGLLEENSGKTIFASSIINALISQGYDSVGFKPLGATELWSHPEALIESKKNKMVVTSDSIMLHKFSREKEPINIINPFGGLLIPVLPEKLRNLNSFSNALYMPNMRLGISRLTLCPSNSLYNTHLINVNAIERSSKSVEYELLDLVSVIENIVKVDDEYILNLISGGALRDIDKCLNYLENRHEIVVIESNSNIASPTPLSTNADVVVIVTPGEAMVVDGNRYKKAIELLNLNGKPWVIKTQEVFQLTNYLFSIELPILEDQFSGYNNDTLNYIIEYIKNIIKQ